ncbi:MAG: hypothetical protein WDN04_12805 [Rhodospirillales bacterium]
MDIWVGAHFQLWFRIGDAGKLFRGTRRTHSFGRPGGRPPAPRQHYFPGEWADRDGNLATSRRRITRQCRAP